MPTVTFKNEKKKIAVPEGANLRAVAMEAGVKLSNGIHTFPVCMGFGCRVFVTKGQENLSQPGITEKAMTRFGGNPLAFFSYLGREDEMRLACQCKVTGDIEVETQAACNWHGEKFWG
tara:strand:- start:130 stop:483 length:354 start_codon:yes stop_codon:yes gene_type:complete